MCAGTHLCVGFTVFLLYFLFGVVCDVIRLIISSLFEVWFFVDSISPNSAFLIVSTIESWFPILLYSATHTLYQMCMCMCTSLFSLHHIDSINSVYAKVWFVPFVYSLAICCPVVKVLFVELRLSFVFRRRQRRRNFFIFTKNQKTGKKKLFLVSFLYTRVSSHTKFANH